MEEPEYSELEEANKLIVVRDEKPDRTVAFSILNYLQDKPEATIADLARDINVPESQIQQVIDSYKIVDGVPQLVGPGKGANWVNV